MPSVHGSADSGNVHGCFVAFRRAGREHDCQSRFLTSFGCLMMQSVIIKGCFLSCSWYQLADRRGGEGPRATARDISSTKGYRHRLQMRNLKCLYRRIGPLAGRLGLGRRFLDILLSLFHRYCICLLLYFSQARCRLEVSVQYVLDRAD
jgi:hypothetical protein